MISKCNQSNCFTVCCLSRILNVGLSHKNKKQVMAQRQLKHLNSVIKATYVSLQLLPFSRFTAAIHYNLLKALAKLLHLMLFLTQPGFKARSLTLQ